MPFTLLTTTTVFRGDRTVIRSGILAAALFQLRTFDIIDPNIIAYGWAYKLWVTGNADVGTVVTQQIRLTNSRHEIICSGVPEGSESIAVYLPERSPFDSTSLALYRRN